MHAKFLELTGTPEPGPVPSLANTADPIWVRDRYRTRIQSQPEDRPSRFQKFMSLALILLGSQGEVVGQDNRQEHHTYQPVHGLYLAAGREAYSDPGQFTATTYAIPRHW